MMPLNFMTWIIVLVSIFSVTSFASTPMADHLSGVEVVENKKILSSFTAPKLGTVVVFLSAKCPCSASHETELKALYQEYEPQGFQFIAIHSNRDEDSEFTRKHFAESKLPFPVIQDVNNQIADAYGALKTPHVFILGKSKEIRYQGGVDDSRIQAAAKKHYLREALTSMAAGKEPSIKETRTLGCVIRR